MLASQQQDLSKHILPTHLGAATEGSKITHLAQPLLKVSFLVTHKKANKSKKLKTKKARNEKH